MIHTYKNAPLTLAKYKTTGVSGESFVLSTQSFLCESVEASLQSNVQPSYLDGFQFATDYSPTDLVQGSLNITYYLTGQDLLRDYFDDNDSRISGNFGGMFFKEGKMSSYSIAGQPNQPIKVNAEIVFFDQLSGTFTPSDTPAEEVQVPNFYNFQFTNDSQDEIGNVNILNFNYSLNNEIIPVKHLNSTLPDSLLVSQRNSQLQAEIDIVSGTLPTSGLKVDLSLDLKDFGGNAIYSLPITGVLNSKNISTSIDDIVRSNISVFSTQVSDQPTITDLTTSGSGESTYFEIYGANLDSSQVIILDDTFVQRAQDNLTTGQLKNIRDNIFGQDIIRSAFSYIDSDGSPRLRFYPPNAATASYPEVVTSVGKVKSAILASPYDPGITIDGLNPNPSAIGSLITISGSGFYSIDEISFGGGVLSKNFNTSNAALTKLSVEVPDLAESGFITVKSTSRDTSGTSTVNFVPIPQIDSASLTTGVTGTLVTLSGLGMNHVTGALFSGSAACTAASNASAQSVDVTVAEDAVFGPITISGALGSSAISPFNFTPIPLLTGVSPSSVDPGDSISLTGIGITTNLLYSPTSDDRYLITFNGQDATGLFKRTSNQGLTGLVPLSAIDGTISPNRTASDLYYSEASLGLKTQAPIITGISLNSGTNDLVILKGTNLSSATGMSFVSVRTNNRVEITGNRFSSTPNATTFRDISFFAPDEGLQNIILKYNDPVKETTGSGIGTGFYYKTQPTITSFTPSSGVLGNEITIQGTGFYSDESLFYFRNTSLGNRLNLNSNYTFLGDNTGVSIPLTNYLSNFFTDNTENLITGSILATNGIGSASTGSSFDLIPTPFISGFAPDSAEVGDTVNVTGRSFFGATGVHIIGATTTTAVPTVTNPNNLSFVVPNGATSGPITVFATGGSFSTNIKSPSLTLKIKAGDIVVSGFEPQPAFIGLDTVTITGTNLSTAFSLRFSGYEGTEVSYTRTDDSPSLTQFKVDSNATSGNYIQFIPSTIISGGNPLQVVNVDGRFSSSQNFETANTSEFLIVDGFSGFGGGSGDSTGYYNKEMVVTGSGFNSTQPVIYFPSGSVNTIDTVKYFSGGNQTIISDNLIKLDLPSGINDQQSPRISGKARDIALISTFPANLQVLPTIKGVSGSYSYEQGSTVEISGLNDASYAQAISGGDLSATFTLKDPNGTDRSLGLNPTDLKIGITGLSFDGQKTVEYIADEIYIDNGSDGTYSAGQNFINYDNKGNLSFEFSVSDRFFGTGRLFLVHPDDEDAIFSGDENGVLRSTEFFANATGFNQSATAKNFENLLFSETITIAELEPTITDFSPVIGVAGTTVTLNGTNLKGVTGLSIFSGSTESLPVANNSFSTQTSTQLVFAAPTFSEQSGQIKIRTSSHEVNSTDYFKYAISPDGGSIVPSTGQAGDTITVNATAGLNDTEQLRLVTLDNVTVTGSFTIVDDTQLTFVIPSEGRLPAPQDVDVQTYNGVNSTSVGTLVVREDSKDIFGDVVVSGNLTVSGFITGHGITGTSITATTGTFTQRPSVNGSGVLLVGEGSASAAGSDGEIQFNDGGSLGANSQLFFDDSSSQLYVSGAGGNVGNVIIASDDNTEGGQVTLSGGKSYSDLYWTIDSYQDKLRIFSGGFPFLQISDRQLQLVNEFNTTITSLNVNGDSFLNGGDVGIGTSSPSAKLHVVGDITGQAISGTSISAPEITNLETATGTLRSDIDSNDTDISALQTATGVLSTATGTLRADIDSNDTDISELQTATGTLRADIDSNDTDISTLQTATGVLRADIDSNDTDISALQTATGVLSQVSVTGSSSIHTPDLTGVGQVTVTLDGSTVKISGGGGTPAGSDNQIQFNDGGSFGASANLTWDDNGLLANGYISGAAISGTSLNVTNAGYFGGDVGIGTGSPSGKLHSVGTIPFVADRGTAVGGYVWQDFHANEARQWRVKSSDTDNEFTIQNASSQDRMTLSQNGTVHFVGDVGIGTGSPTGKLHSVGVIPFVADRGTVVGGYVWQDFYANGTKQWRLRSSSTDNEFTLQNASTQDQMTLSQNGDVHLVGDVGIGTSSPSAKLHVVGDITGQAISGTSISAPEITNLETATGTLRADINSNDTDISALQTATGVLSQVSVTGSSSIHTPDLTGVGQVTVTLDGSTVKISGASAGGGTPAGSDNQIQFNDGGSFGASANLTWDDNGLYSNGYISGTAISGQNLFGISGEFGTAARGVIASNPSSLVRIHGYDDPKISLYANNGWSNWEIHGGVNDYLEIKNAGTNPNKYVNLDNLCVGAQSEAGEASFYSNTGKPAIYATCGGNANNIFSGVYGGTPIFVFNRHGNVLMGGTTAQGQVSVSGFMNATPVMAITEGANTTDILQLKDTSNNVGWVVDTDFNLGIGTSSPSQKLHVNLGRIAVSDGYNIGNVAADAGMFFDSDSDLFLQAGKTTHFVLESGGNVGIGTTSPSAKLHVVGDITGHAISGTSISAPEITNLETATGTLRSDIDSNDTDISALQTATGVLSQVSVTGSSSIHAPDLTGVGQVTVTLDGSTVKISGAAGGGGGTPAGSDTQVQFNDGGSFGADSSFTWDKTSDKLTIAVSHTDDALLLNSTEASSTASPVLTLKRDSSSPADGDYLGQLKFKGESDTSTERVYAKITAKILDASNGTEDGLIEYMVREAGSNKIMCRFRGDGIRVLNDANFIAQEGSKLGVGNTNPTYQVDVVGTGNFTQDGYFGGDVGIGTSSPATKLHVIGGISGHDITGSSFIQGDAKANEFYAVKVNRSAASNNSVDIWDQNGAGVVIGATASEKTLTVDAGGSVGIGTVAPASNLHVMGAANAELRIECDDTSGNPFTHYKLDGGTSFSVGIDDGDSNSFKISNNATLGTNDYVTISTAGLVTLNSAQTVGNFIAGDNDGTADGARLEVWSQNNQSPFAIINTNNSNRKVLDSAFTSDHVAFSIYNASQTETVKLDVNGDSFFNGGNVGIATSSPSAKLHVVGVISGQAISGTSFHGDHFVSNPHDIGNTSGTVTIDFNNGSTQLATLNGNVTAFAASNPAAGESVVVQFKTTAARTISPGSTLAFIGDHPTGLSANMTGVLSLMSFDGSTVMAGFATQTGVG